MANHRPWIRTSIKKTLFAEAGGKCANPGCPNRRTQIHHIKDWAVYQTHDQAHMIAICPACHDAVHNGSLRIDDDTLYRWRHIHRPDSTIRGHVYVEPGAMAKLLLGTIAVSAPDGAIVFELSQANKLKYIVKDGNILLVNLTVSSMRGEVVLQVTDNYISHEPSPDIDFQSFPGNVRLTAPCNDEFIPPWALHKMKGVEPAFAVDSRLTYLAIEVVRAGVVRIEGVWSSPERVIVVTKERITFLYPDPKGPVSLIGEGESSVLYQATRGVIDVPLFGPVSGIFKV